MNLLDRCLSSFIVPRWKLQLLGCVALLVESQRGGPDHYEMTIGNVVYISDSQYNGFQAIAMYNLIVGNTQHPVQRMSGCTTYDFLTMYLKMMGLENMREAEAPQAGVRYKEDIVFANLLADLSLLDYYMLRFQPSSIAAAVVYLSRLTLHYFSEQRLSMTSVGVVPAKSRELLSLVTSRRPFVEKNMMYTQEPFGISVIRQFVMSAVPETNAVFTCVKRLWMLHKDYYTHVNGGPEPPCVLRSHSYMLKVKKNV